MKKIIGALLIAGLPGVSHADTSIDELKSELLTLQRKVDELEKSAAAAASAKSQNPDPGVSATEFASLKQQVAKQDLQVETLSTAASEGPTAGLSVTGYLDPVYLYNRNARSGGFSFLDHNSAYTYYNGNAGDVYLDIKKTFGVGPLAPSAEIQIQPNRGAGNTTLDGAKGNNMFNTAFVTIPHDDANQFVAGLMPSLAGYEYQQSNTLPTLTHNLLYDFSIPGYFVGIGYNGSHGEYTWKVILGNEQNLTHAATASDSSARLHTNLTPMINWRIDRSKGAWDWGWSAAVGRQLIYSGNAAGDCTSGGFGYNCSSSGAFSTYMFTEIDASYAVADSTFNAEFDLGNQKHAAWNGGDATWWGFSLLYTQKWRLPTIGLMGFAARWDYLNDSKNGGGGGNTYVGGSSIAGSASPGTDGLNGFGIDPACLASSNNNGQSCKGANHQDIALDLMFYPAVSYTVKVEYRHDWSNRNVFQRADGSWRKSNDVIGTTLVYTF
jgi:outer membrane murein-binding lipoprotein Lpp